MLDRRPSTRAAACVTCLMLAAATSACGDDQSHGDTVAATRSAPTVPETLQVAVLFVLDDTPSVRAWEMGDALVDAATELEETWQAAEFVVGVTTLDPDRGLVADAGPTQALNCMGAPEEFDECSVLDGELSTWSGLFFAHFACLVHVGDCGSGFERGLEAAASAMEAWEAARTADSVVLVFVTPSDDCSGPALVPRDCEDSERLDAPETFADRVAAARADGGASTWVVAVVGAEGTGSELSGGTSCATNGERVADGARYRAFGRHFDERFVEADVCTLDWSWALSKALADAVRPAHVASWVCLDPTPAAACLSDGDCRGRCIGADGDAPGLCEDFSVTAARDATESVVSPGSASGDFYLDYRHPSCGDGPALVYAGPNPADATEFTATWEAARADE